MEQPQYWRRLATERISRRVLLKSAAAGALGLAAACGGDDKAPGADGGLSAAKSEATTAAAAAASGSNGVVAGNAIIVVLDTLRADHVGAYGNDWIKTPSMDALAEESIVFTHAFPESLPTLPMRRSLHTGLRTWPVHDWTPDKGDVVAPLVRGWQRIPEEQVTISESLMNQGYHTAFITDTHHYFKPSKNYHRGFRQFSWVRGQESDPWRSTLNVDPQEVEALLPPGLSDAQAAIPNMILTQYLANQAGRESEEDYQAPRVFREAMDWLEENRKAERFFLLLDVFDPHEPWDPPQDYIDMYADPDYDGPPVIQSVYGPSDYLTDDQLQHMRARYAAEVTMVDRWLGRFLDRARELGMLDDTLLIVTSDHGHQLGEHGITGKVARGMWYELMDVPLVVRRPDGIGAGARVDAFALTHDIPATMLGALGADHRVPLPGVNLLELAADRIPPREHVSSGARDYSWCRDGRYVYITRNDRTDIQLFDMDADPLQEHDLAVEEPGVVEAMHQKLLVDADGPLPV